MPEIRKLNEATDSLVNQLAELTGELKRVDDDAHLNRRLAQIGVTAAVLAIIGMLFAIGYGRDAKATSREIISVRTETRISACVQDNKKVAGQRAAFQAFTLVFGHPNADGTLPPQEQALLDTINQAVIDVLPFRDCSPAGIEQYYSSPPADPAASS